MRELRLAKKRIIVQQQFLQTEGRGQDAYFDLDRELFTPMNFSPPPTRSSSSSSTSPSGSPSTPRLAWRWPNGSFARLGYSAQSFGLKDEGSRISR